MVKKTLRKKGIKRRRNKSKRRQTSGGTVTPIEVTQGIEVTYGTTLIKNNEDLTGKALLYNQTPLIKYTLNKYTLNKYTLNKYKPRDEKTFLITMTDPDAPSGIWPHYVITLKANTLIKVLYPYHPPTPPPNTGVHHYIFNAYLYTAADEAKLNNPTLLTGNAYYKQLLEPVIKNKSSYAKFQFTIKA